MNTEVSVRSIDDTTEFYLCKIDTTSFVREFDGFYITFKNKSEIHIVYWSEKLNEYQFQFYLNPFNPNGPDYPTVMFQINEEMCQKIVNLFYNK